MKTVKERLMSKVVEDNNGCWLFTGTDNGTGYGRFKVNGIRKLTHRVSYELHVGLIPIGLFVLHKCDVRNCINPEHLFLGTHQDNADDKMAKGRHVPKTIHKSTLAITSEALKMLKSGITQTKVAYLLGVGRKTIRNIEKRAA